jgi:hypothetical protein
MAEEARQQGADPDIAHLIRRFGRDAETALIRLPGAPDVQESMKHHFTLINGYTLADRLGELFAEAGWPADNKLRQIGWARISAARAVQTLGAFLREEELPDWRDVATIANELRPTRDLPPPPPTY